MIKTLPISLAVVLAFSLMPQAVAEEKKPQKRKSVSLLMFDAENDKAAKGLKGNKKPKGSKYNFEKGWPSKVSK